MTVHAEEEVAADGYTIYDVERGIVTGRIIERQRDRKTGERKYRVRGHTAGEASIEIVAKRSLTGAMVIITVYEP
ncbi:MAG: DUF4258 domain-containing protein [Gemmatimonadota bacterium]